MLAHNDREGSAEPSGVDPRIEGGFQGEGDDEGPQRGSPFCILQANLEFMLIASANCKIGVGFTIASLRNVFGER